MCWESLTIVRQMSFVIQIKSDQKTIHIHAIIIKILFRKIMYNIILLKKVFINIIFVILPL